MKKEALTGIHFLEKTSYCDPKKDHFPLLWIMIQLGAFGCVVLSTVAMLFVTLGFEFDMGLVGGMVAVGTLVCWLLSGRRMVFAAAVTVTFAGGAIYVWYHLESVAAGFLSLYHRGNALVSDYLAGVSDSSEWSGRLGTEIYVLLVLALVVICGLFVFGFKKTLPALLPGILCAIGALLVGKVPPLPWFAIYLVSAVTLSACGYNRSRFGKSSALDTMSKHFFIRGMAGKSRNIGAWSALAVLAAMALCIGLAFFIKDRFWSPDKAFLATYQKEIRGWYKENVHLLDSVVDKTRGPAKGGVNGGNLGSVGDLYYRGDEQLRVNVEVFPRWTVYIKGYVGDEYENNRWTTDKSGDYETFVEDHGLTAKTMSQLVDLPFFGLEYAGLDRMHIEKLAEFGDYVFMPYGAHTGEDAAWRQDLYIGGSGDTSEFDYSPAVYEYMKDYDGLQGMFGQGMTGGLEGLELEPAYREYVYAHYTQVPEATRQMLGEFSGLPQLATLKEKVVYVRRQLHDACTYSLTPGNLPAGKDFTEYFLTENKMGYCMHFATAATLMLRSLGVPARYVEGYIAVPGNFRGTGDGFEAVVRDHQAHAWTEVYLDGFGWVPVEMTPAYYDEANINAELDGNAAQNGADETTASQETDADGNPIPETDENGSTIPQTDADGNPIQETDENGNPIPQTDADGNPIPQTDENGNPLPQTDENGETVLAGGTGTYGAGGKGDGTGGAGGSGAAGAIDAAGLSGMVLKLLLWLGGTLAVVLLIAAALALRAWLIHKKRMSAMTQKDKSRALVSIYGSLIRLFEGCGYRYSDFDNMHDYFEKVSGDFDCVDMDVMDAFTDEVNRAAFSRDGADKETWQEGWRLYQNIRTEVLRSQKWLRRMYLKYIRGC